MKIVDLPAFEEELSSLSKGLDAGSSTHSVVWAIDIPRHCNASSNTRQTSFPSTAREKSSLDPGFSALPREGKVHGDPLKWSTRGRWLGVDLCDQFHPSKIEKTERKRNRR